MGVFWHVAVLKKQSRVDVQEVLKELAAEIGRAHV